MDQVVAGFNQAYAADFGYRFEYRGRSLVISGDTRKTDSVAEAARGADLLLHEALAPHLVALLTDAAETAGRSGLAKITRDILDYHTTPVEAAEIAQTAGVRALVLYHIVPPVPTGSNRRSGSSARNAS